MQVGSSTWLQQHDWIDKLNMQVHAAQQIGLDLGLTLTLNVGQAHHNAQTHSDEFVLELLVSLGKLDTLVHNLLVIETWKEAVYPFLNHHIASNVDPIITYTLLFHEAVLANVLEVRCAAPLGRRLGFGWLAGPVRGARDLATR